MCIYSTLNRKKYYIKEKLYKLNEGKKYKKCGTKTFFFFLKCATQTKNLSHI